MTRRISWDPPATPFRWAHVAPLGVTRDMIHTAWVTRRITRLANGVYVASEAVPTDPTDRHLQLALAHQLLRPSAIASHHTAALAFDLALADPAAAADSPPAFIIPTSRSRRSMPRGPVTIALRDLPRHHRAEHPSGLVVTTPARSAVDVASTLPLPEALLTLDAAARLALRELVGSSRVRQHYLRPASLDAAVRPLREAASVAATQFTRRTIERLAALADPRRESALESLSDGQMVLAGLPLPELQARIVLPGGTEVFPDFLWAQQMVIGEADGMLKYGNPEDLHREKLRQEQLEQMGYLVVRWTYEEMRSRPWAVLRRLAAALEARAGR